MKNAPNKQYNIASSNSLPVRIATKQRRRIFDDFLNVCSVSRDELVLDIGVTSDKSYSSSNYLEAWLENKSRIIAVGIDDASCLEKLYPGLKYLKANGLYLPFLNKSVDIVHSSAVIEHVGSFANQVKFISECARVSKKSFYITTPNRYYPIELHTILPIVHWLPKKLFRFFLRCIGFDFFSMEQNLNLMSKRDLNIAARLALCDTNFNFEIRNVKLMGWASNLILNGSVNKDS